MVPCTPSMPSRAASSIHLDMAISPAGRGGAGVTGGGRSDTSAGRSAAGAGVGGAPSPQRPPEPTRPRRRGGGAACRQQVMRGRLLAGTRRAWRTRAPTPHRPRCELPKHRPRQAARRCTRRRRAGDGCLQACRAATLGSHAPCPALPTRWASGACARSGRKAARRAPSESSFGTGRRGTVGAERNFLNVLRAPSPPNYETPISTVFGRNAKKGKGVELLLAV